MRLEKVSGHYRRDAKGKRVKVKGFKRKAKPKGRVGSKKDKRPTKIIYYRDSQGRLLSKRVVV